MSKLNRYVIKIQQGTTIGHSIVVETVMPVNQLIEYIKIGFDEAGMLECIDCGAFTENIYCSKCTKKYKQGDQE